MSKYSHLDLIRQRYPKPGCLKAYQALLDVVCGHTDEVDWHSFSQPEWDLLSDLTLREGLAGLVYHAWKESQRPANVPILLFAQLGAVFLRNQQQFSATQTELTNRIAKALAESGLKMVITKGTALAGSLYPKAGLRPMIDLDCLVSRSALSPTAAVLSELGYEEDRNHLSLPWRGFQEHHMVMRLPNEHLALPLELHYALLNAREDFFELNIEWFLSQTEPFYIHSANGKNAPDTCLLTFTPTAHLLHLAIHLMMHHGAGASDLLHFYDIHLLLERWGRQINWDKLLAAARDMNLDYVLYAAVAGCSDRFGTPIPPALSRPPSGRRVQSLKNYIEVREKVRPQTSTERYLRKLSNRPLFSQIAIVFRFAFPKPEYMRWRYRLKPAWLWPLSYPIRWGIGINHLFSMLTRRSKIK
ncbi:MAG: nucleotidyltransferase family protein [Anaerolineaceae bacterium]|nr:nucleotidyltransferase family protein [Anaerolineaceae bacterium]